MIDQIKEKSNALLDDFLAEMFIGEEVGGEIVLEDASQVDYQIQKIARLDQKKQEHIAFVKGQMEELQRFLERRLGTIQKEIDWRSGPLELYVRDANRRNPKIKSLDLPSGKLKLRVGQERYVCDNPIILAWADFHNEQSFVIIEKKVVLDELKNFVKTTGEIPDGVTIEPAGEPKFCLEIKGEEKGGEENG